MDEVEKLADALYKDKAERSICMHFTQDELRTLAREAAKIGWEEGRDTEYYIHYDNPYDMPKEPS